VATAYVLTLASFFLRQKYGLKGFCTGMFISDYYEALMYCVNSHTAEIDKSNNDFAKVVGHFIFSDDYFAEIKKEYKIENPVTDFNNNSLYQFL